MISISTVIKNIDSSEKKLKLALNSLPAPDKSRIFAGEQLTLSGVFYTLIFDFLLVIGHSIENIIPLMSAMLPSITNYAHVFVENIGTEQPRIPPCMLQLIDNQYGTIQGSTFYDIQNDEWVNNLTQPPVCSISVSLPALYLNSIAVLVPAHQQLAHAFKQGKITLP